MTNRQNLNCHSHAQTREIFYKKAKGAVQKEMGSPNYFKFTILQNSFNIKKAALFEVC